MIILNFLRNRGIPTIFEIDYPVSKFSQYDLTEIFIAVLFDYDNGNIDLEYDSSSFPHTVYIFDLIDPKFIVNHFHPDNLKRPSYNNGFYDIYVHNKRCKMCDEKGVKY